LSDKNPRFPCRFLCVQFINATDLEANTQKDDPVKRQLDEVNIALVGKYTGMEDAYASVLKALTHAALFCNRKLKVLVRNQSIVGQKSKISLSFSLRTVY